MKLSFFQLTDNNTLDRGAVSYVGIMGGGYVPATLDENASYPQNATLMGGGGGTLRNFRIRISAAPGASKSYTFALRKNSVATSVSIAISGASDTTGADLTTDITYVDGDTIQWEITPAGTPAVVQMVSSCQVDTTNPFLYVGTSISSVGTRLTQVHAQVGLFSASFDDFDKLYMPGAFTIKNLRLLVTDAPGAGESYAITLNKNGDQALTATISDAEVTASDLSNEVAVVEGDLLYWKIVSSAGAATSGLKVVADLIPATRLDFFYLSRPGNTTTNPTVWLVWACGGGAQAYGLTEFQGTVPTSVDGAVFRDLKIRLNGAPGAGKSIVFTVVKNGVATAMVVTISDSDTTGEDIVNEVPFDDGDTIAIAQTEVNDPADKNWQISFGYTSPHEAAGTAPIRVTALVGYWSAGPNPVNQLQIMLGGLSSQYFSPISPEQEPTPTLQDRKPARDILSTMLPTLREHIQWMASHSQTEQRAIFGTTVITLQRWQDWVMSLRAMGKEIP